MGVGDSLARRGGASGSFFTGILASIAATPCTAPFMGAALGYAVTQPAVEATAVVMMLGLGFALPMTLLSLSGAFARLLPKPGPWMETLKQVLAFPLYAPRLCGSSGCSAFRAGADGVLAAGAVLLAIGFAAWLRRHDTGRAHGYRYTGAAAVVLIAAFALAGPMLGVAQDVGHARQPAADGVPQAKLGEPFSMTRLERAARAKAAPSSSTSLPRGVLPARSTRKWR